MTGTAIRRADDPRLAEYDRLRQALRAQRQVIALRLGPATATPSGTFPRSRSLRFLMRRPAIALQLLKTAAIVVVGARMVRVAAGALLVASVLRSVSRRDPAG